ncbi:MAG: hypothetical protein KDE08_04675 [Rhodobacteraceae bacterium]|nr:hypothetical protein [Paracoccaceae bacterium]
MKADRTKLAQLGALQRLARMIGEADRAALASADRARQSTEAEIARLIGTETAAREIAASAGDSALLQVAERYSDLSARNRAALAQRLTEETSRRAVCHDAACRSFGVQAALDRLHAKMRAGAKGPR